MKNTAGTEDASLHDELEQRSSIDLLQRINQEDQKIAQLVADAGQTMNPRQFVRKVL